MSTECLEILNILREVGYHLAAGQYFRAADELREAMDRLEKLMEVRNA